MEKAEKITKRRSGAAEVDGRRKKKKPREAEEEEVEEFYALLRRMRGAAMYFERAGSGGGKQWRAALERAGGVELSVNGGAPLKAEELDVVPRREGVPVVLDLNASPEESHGGD